MTELAYLKLDDTSIFSQTTNEFNDPLIFKHFTEGKYTFQGNANNMDMICDLLCSGNMVINSNLYTENIIMSRDFGSYVISYGLRINNNEDLEMFKHDTRVNKSTTVMMFGPGNITPQSDTNNETLTFNYSNVMAKSEFLNLFRSNIY
jgi:hypothetical protein